MSDKIGKVLRVRTTEEIEASGEYNYKIVLPDGIGEPLFANTVEEMLPIICSYGVIHVIDLKYGGTK